MPRSLVVQLQQLRLSVLDCAVSLKTAIDYDRNFENYKKFCSSCRMPHLPLGYANLSMYYVWLVMTFEKATMVNPTSAAIEHKRVLLGLPAMPPEDQARLARLKRGLHKLAPHIAKQAAPLTLEVLSAMVEKVEVKAELLKQFSDKVNGMEKQRTPHQERCDKKLAWVQWKARAFMSHSAMLRASDHTLRERKAWNQMTKACIRWQADLLVLWVPPGKANADFEPTFHSLTLSDKSAAKWFLYYYVLFDFDSKPQDTFLWPRVHAGFILWDQVAKCTQFIAVTIYLLTITGFPAVYIAQVTGHSFRSGGCTDYLAAGAPDHFVKLQGRWRSDCYTVYRRHSMAYGRQVSQRLFTELQPAWQQSDYDSYWKIVASFTDEDGI